MTKAVTRAEARRRKQQRKPSATTPDAPQRQDKPTARPTPERWAMGHWAEAQGSGRDARPLVDLASDLIGRLYVERKITSSQHEAARRFLEVRERFMAELGTVGFRSCLAGGSGGFDSGDGDVSAVLAYKRMSAHLGPRLRVLVDNVHKLGHERVTDMDGLRAALDHLAGVE